MSIGRLASLALILSAALGVVRAAAADDTDARRVTLVGCSVAPPEGGNWLAQPFGRWNSLWVKRHSEVLYTTAAFVDVGVSDDRDKGTEQRISEMRAIIVTRELSGRKNASPIEFQEMRLDSSVTPFTIRYRYRFEDPKVKVMKGRNAVTTVSGLRVWHPAAKLVIDVVFSERAPEGTEFVDGQVGEHFLGSLRLHQAEVALEPSGHTLPDGAVVTRAFDAVWVASRPSRDGKQVPGELLRLDPTTLTVTGRVALGAGPCDMAVAGGALWVAHDGEGSLFQVDPAAVTVTRRLKLGKEVTRLAVAAGALWATDLKAGDLWRVDPTTGAAARQPSSRFRTPLPILAADSLLWVADMQNRVVAVDPATGSPSGASVGVGSGPRDLAWGEGSLWVLCYSMHAVQRIDPVRRVVTATIPLPRLDPDKLAFHAGALWVNDWSSGVLMRIDPATNEVSEQVIHVGVSAGMCSADDGLWVLDRVAERVGRYRPPAP